MPPGTHAAIVHAGVEVPDVTATVDARRECITLAPCTAPDRIAPDRIAVFDADPERLALAWSTRPVVMLTMRLGIRFVALDREVVALTEGTIQRGADDRVSGGL